MLLRASRSVRVLMVRSQRNSSGFLESHDFHEYGDQIKSRLKKSSKLSNLWNKVFIFCSIPALIVSAITAYQIHHSHKFDQSSYVEYPYMNVRKKPFPWGDGNHTLFHNKKVQYTPGVGFEEMCRCIKCSDYPGADAIIFIVCMAFFFSFMYSSIKNS